MSDSSNADPRDTDTGGEHAPDPLDVQAANIDARSPDAPEEIGELIDHAEELGRDPEQDVVDDADNRS